MSEILKEAAALTVCLLFLVGVAWVLGYPVELSSSSWEGEWKCTEEEEWTHWGVAWKDGNITDEFVSEPVVRCVERVWVERLEAGKK